MMTRFRRALVAAVALAAAISVVPAPAHAGAPPADKGDLLFVARTCSSQDGFVDIGGRLKMREFGEERHHAASGEVAAVQHGSQRSGHPRRLQAED